MSVYLRRAEAADVEAIVDLGAAVVPQHYTPILGARAAQAQLSWWTPERMASGVAAGRVHVAVADDVVVGVAQTGELDGEQVIWKLYLAPGFRGRSLGVRLLRQAIAALPAGTGHVLVEHVAGNTGAGRFYEREGFTEVRTVSADSGDPHAAVVWRRLALSGPATAQPMPETLQTRRLALRVLGSADLDVVHGLFSGPGHTIGDGPVRDRAETARWLVNREVHQRERGLAWYGLWDARGAFAGSCGVFPGQRCGDEPEIGYEVDVAHRGKGFGHEAARVVTEAAHAAGHARIWATIRPRNLASARILEKLGYQLVTIETDARGDLAYYLSRASTPVR